MLACATRRRCVPCFHLFCVLVECVGCQTFVVDASYTEFQWGLSMGVLRLFAIRKSLVAFFSQVVAKAFPDIDIFAVYLINSCFPSSEELSMAWRVIVCL